MGRMGSMAFATAAAAMLNLEILEWNRYTCNVKTRWCIVAMTGLMMCGAKLRELPIVRQIHGLIRKTPHKTIHAETNALPLWALTESQLNAEGAINNVSRDNCWAHGMSENDSRG